MNKFSKKGIDINSINKVDKVKDESELDQFVPAQDSPDVRFREFMMDKAGNRSETVSQNNTNKRVKLADVTKSLYELSDSLKIDDYTKSREVIDRKIWVTGISEVSKDEIENKKNVPVLDKVDMISKSLGGGIKTSVLRTQK